MNMITEEELADVIAKNRILMLAQAFRILQNWTDAEDAYSETVVKAFENRKSLQKKEAAKPWLMRIVVNVSKNLIRVKARMLPTADIALYENVPNRAAGRMLFSQNADLPEQSVEAERIRDAVDDLPIDYRTVIRWYYFEGFSVREISRRLHIAEGTVKSRLSRARKRLAAMLGALAAVCLLIGSVVHLYDVAPRVQFGEASHPTGAAEDEDEAVKQASIQTARTYVKMSTIALSRELTDEEYLRLYRLLTQDGGAAEKGKDVRYVASEKEIDDTCICFALAEQKLFLPKRELSEDEIASILRMMQNAPYLVSEASAECEDERVASGVVSTDSKIIDEDIRHAADEETQYAADEKPPRRDNNVQQKAVIYTATEGGKEQDKEVTMNMTVSQATTNMQNPAYTTGRAKPQGTQNTSTAQGTENMSGVDREMEELEKEIERIRTENPPKTSALAGTNIEETKKKVEKVISEPISLEVTMDELKERQEEIRAASGLQKADLSNTDSALVRMQRSMSMAQPAASSEISDIGKELSSYRTMFDDISAGFKDSFMGKAVAFDYSHSDITSADISFDTIGKMADAYDRTKTDIEANYTADEAKIRMDALDEAYESSFSNNILNPIKETFDTKFNVIEPNAGITGYTLETDSKETLLNEISTQLSMEARKRNATEALTEGTKDFYALLDEPSKWHDADYVSDVIKKSVDNYSAVKEVNRDDSAYFAAKAAADAIAKEISDKYAAAHTYDPDKYKEVMEDENASEAAKAFEEVLKTGGGIYSIDFKAITDLNDWMERLRGEIKE